MRQLHRASRLLYASAVVLGVVVALLLVARFANTTATVRARRVAVHRSGTSRTTQNRVAVSRFTAGGEAQQRAAFIPAASLSLPDVDVEDTEDEWTDGDALGDAPAASPSYWPFGVVSGRADESRDAELPTPAPLPLTLSPERMVVVTIVDAPAAMADLRNLVGSLHQHRDTQSDIVPIVVVYGIQLTPTHEHEIALWSGVEYHDAARFLIPTKDVLSFTRNATVRGNVVAAASLRISTLSAERLYLLKLTLLNAACRRFGSCVFIDVRHAIHSATALTNMATMLSTHGYLFGCDDEGVGTPTNVTTAVPTATPTIAHCPVVGFVYESFAYVNLVVEPLTCLRMGDCDERRVLDTMAGEDLEIRMVDQVLGVADEAIIKNGAFYYCYISLREDLLYSYRFAMDGANVEPAVLKSNNKIHIGLGVPTTGAKLTRAEQSSVLTAFLPSFLKSIADDEWQRFTFTLYLSFDEGDHLWDDSRNFANLDRHIHTMIGPHSESINVKFIRLPATHGWLTYIWNMMFARSMNDGCDYYYQLNDDLHFESAGWATMLTGKLSEHNGFGVAGPNDPVWKCKILTQAMVSRTHWKIFGWFYPPEIKDWYSDFWLSGVYGPQATYCDLDTRVRNLRDKGTRYQLCNRPRWYQAMQRDKERIKQWREDVLVNEQDGVAKRKGAITE